MKFRVLDDCTLLRPDGSVWANAGDVIDIAVDSADPLERTAAQKSLRGQHRKVTSAPDPVPSAPSNRAISEPAVVRKVGAKKASKRGPKE